MVRLMVRGPNVDMKPCRLYAKRRIRYVCGADIL